MTDIHSHLLFGVDDGSKTLEESLSVLRDMENEGFKNIILTPHYIKGSKYNSVKEENEKKLEILKSACRENNININLYLGNEIFIDDNIYEMLKNGEISSLNKTNYLLIEIPLSGIYDDYKDVFAFLMSKGYKIILAHPERYTTFQEDFERVMELSKMGVYFQSNLDSLTGKYGEAAKKTIKKMLKRKKVAFLATDVHHKHRDYKWAEARKIALKYLTTSELDILINRNPSQLVD